MKKKFVVLSLAFALLFSSIPSVAYDINETATPSLTTSETENFDVDTFIGKNANLNDDSIYESIPITTVSLPTVTQPTQYSNEFLDAYEIFCSYIQMNHLSFEVSIESFYESYCMGGYTSLNEYLENCYLDISEIASSDVQQESTISTYSSVENSRWYYNTGTSPNQEPNYSKYNLLNIVKKGDIIHEAGNHTVGHIAIVEGIYYNWVYGQYYIRLVESIGYFSSDGEAEGVCRSVLDDDRFDEREGTILRLNSSYYDEDAISSAVAFCVSQIGKHFDYSLSGSSTESTESKWYCSELVWAAYMNQGIDLDIIKAITVSPGEVLNSSKLDTIASYSSIQTTGTPEITFLSAPTTTSARISWYGVSSATSYNIYRSTGAASTYSLIATTTSTSYTDTSLSSNGHYCYKISAVVSGRESNTGTVRAVRTSFTSPLIMSLNSTSSKVSLQWSPVYGATEYFVCRSTSENGTYTRFSTTSTLTFTDTDIIPGTTYYYKVEAYNGSTLLESSVSNILPLVVNTPSIYYANAWSTGNATIKWTYVLPATSYIIFRSTSPSSGYSAIGTSERTYFVDTGLTVGTKYYYKIIATNGTDNSEFSGYKGVTAS